MGVSLLKKRMGAVPMTAPRTGGFWRATAFTSAVILMAACSTSSGESTKSVAPPGVLRTLPVASGAPITVNVLSSPITGSSTTNLPVTLNRLGQFKDLEMGVFWLTIRRGVVTRIAEQYLP